MADKDIQLLINRIKTEGELNRNKGAHSIKSVKTEIVPVLNEIAKSTYLTSLMISNMLGIQTEQLERAKSAADLASVEGDDKDKKVSDGEKDTKPKEPKIELGTLGDILKALALAPFAFKFAKGFVSAITDDLVELTFGGIVGLSAMIQGKMNGLFTALAKPFVWIGDWVNTKFAERFATFTDRIKNIQEGVSNALSKVGNFFRLVRGKFVGLSTFMSEFSTKIMDAIKVVTDLPILKTIKLILTKLALPLTLIMGVYDGVKEFMSTEGNTLEKFLAGIGGFLGEIIGAPLDLLKSLVAWVLKKFRFDETAAELKEFSFEELIKKVFGSLYGYAESAIEWVKKLFSWGAGVAVEGWTNLTTFVSDTWDKVKTWFTRLFDWGEGVVTEGWTNLTTFVSDQWTKVKDWIYRLFDWGAGVAVEGWTNLTTFVSEVWTKVKGWFTRLFSWGTGVVTEGWTNLVDFVSGVWTKVKDWFEGLFSWGEGVATKGWTNLTDFVSGVWESVKVWIGKKLGFVDDSEEGEGISLMKIWETISGAIMEKIELALDSLPSIEEIKAILMSYLPKWMQPDSIEEQKQKIRDEITRLQQQQADAPTAEDAYWWQKTKDDYQEDIENELARLEQLNKGGIVTAPKSGGLAMLHGTEAVIPLDSPEGMNILAAKTASLISGGAQLAAAPTIVTMAGGNKGGDVYNTGGNTTTTTIINTVDDPSRALRAKPA